MFSISIRSTRKTQSLMSTSGKINNNNIKNVSSTENALDLFREVLFPSSTSKIISPSTNFTSTSICDSMKKIFSTRRGRATFASKLQKQHVMMKNIFHPLLASISSNVALQFVHLIAPRCASAESNDTFKKNNEIENNDEQNNLNLADELQIFLLADNKNNKNSHNNNDNNSSSASSMLLLDLEVPSVVAASTQSLSRVTEQLLDYSLLSLSTVVVDTTSKNKNKTGSSSSSSLTIIEKSSTAFLQVEAYYTHLLSSVIISQATSLPTATQTENSGSIEDKLMKKKNSDFTSHRQLQQHEDHHHHHQNQEQDDTHNNIEHHFIPSNLYPSLLAFSDPSLCEILIERDVDARLAAIAGHNNSALLTSITVETEQPGQDQDQEEQEQDKMLMLKILSSPSSSSSTNSNYYYQNHPCFNSNTNNINSNGGNQIDINAKAPIDPVVFLKLFGSVLRNQGFAKEETFQSAHKVLILLVSSYSAQLPPSDSFMVAKDMSVVGNSNAASASASASSSFHGTVRNVVTLLLIRLSRLYGRTARAVEFGELHRSLRDSVPWMIHMAPMLYWTWLLGSTLDAARSPAITAVVINNNTHVIDNTAINSAKKAIHNTSSSPLSCSTVASSVIFSRLLLPLRVSAVEAILEKNLDVEALALLWVSFVPHLQEAVTIATSRLLDEASRKIRTTCIKVALLLDENDTAVAGRCELARKMGLPFTFQRLLTVYNTWGYHTVFFPSAAMASNSNNNSSDGSLASSASSSWTIDPKEATSQVIRLFGVALRRGCIPLMMAHPAEFERPLLDFIEQINADRPFALMDATSNILSILSEVYTISSTSSHDQSDLESLAKASKKEQEGISKVAFRIWEWLRAVLRSNGRGGWDPQTIAPIALSLETLGVLPKSAFWWQCGCGAKNPSASIRCTMCLRRVGSCHWTCANEKCKAKQYLDQNNSNKSNNNNGGNNASSSSSSASASVKKRCIVCETKHPWLATLENKFQQEQQQNLMTATGRTMAEQNLADILNDADEKQELPQQNRGGLLLACSKCLEVQRIKSNDEDDHEIAALLIQSGGSPLIDLCGIGRCVTFLKQQNQPLIGDNDKTSGPKNIPNNNTSSASFVARNFISSSNDIANITNNSSNNSAVSSNYPASWTCVECATECTSPACSTCGLARDGNVSMWCCDDCGSWNFGNLTRCRRGCATKKRSSQKPIPYVRWKCGCGATNPMWRSNCGRCCPRNNNNNNNQLANTTAAPEHGKLYTCPSCHHKPLQAPFRRVREHHYRPGFTLMSCGDCGADHPRDLAIVRSVHFERPCVSCGDWHTLPGLVVAKKSIPIPEIDDDDEADFELNVTDPLVNNKNMKRGKNVEEPTRGRRPRRNQNDAVLESRSAACTTSRTTCCSHCGCETDASAEPFSKWICETCTYEKQKQQNSNPAESSSTDSVPPQQQCWRTGYRCSDCGDLHPSLAFSVIRNGIAARFNNGDPHDAVFLWKCQGTDIQDPDSCCGHFNPSWDTQCCKCGQIRLVPPPLMTKASPCSGVSDNNKKQKQQTQSSPSSSSSTVSTGNNNNLLVLLLQQQQEIRARYLPWSCEVCHAVQPPEEVLFCTKCFNPRTPPPCNVCGGNHISLYCPPPVSASVSSTTNDNTSSSGTVFQQFY